MKLSVIIPVLREQATIRKTLHQLQSQLPNAEFVVVDGDPTGSSIACLDKTDTIICLTAAAGRGAQINRGLATAQGDLLMVLHLDSTLTPLALKSIQELASKEPFFACFHLAFDESALRLRLVSLLANIRTSLLALPYGDQCFIFNRATLEKAGPFPELPLMEDVAFAMSCRRAGLSARLLPGHVRTSARRYTARGILGTALRNMVMLVKFLSGTSPQKLYEEYYR